MLISNTKVPGTGREAWLYACEHAHVHMYIGSKAKQ